MKYALLADIHGNLPALEAVLKLLGSDCQIIVAGDVLGYFPFFNQSVSLLRECGAKFVKGNHEAFELKEILRPQHLVFREFGHLFHQKATPETRVWLQELPDNLIFDTAWGTMHICHGSPWSINEYLYPHRLDPDRFIDEKSKIFVQGHTHYELLQQYKDLQFINPGSVGLPRGGGYRASFALLDDEQHSVTFHRIDYDPSPLKQIVERWDFPSCFSDFFSGEDTL